MRHLQAGLAAGLAATLALTPATALEDVRFRAPGADEALERTLRDASLLLDDETRVDNVQELLATARAEYGRLLAALYSEGHYGGAISIEIDGREASTIPPLDPPAAINRITVTVQPGPQYEFSQAHIAPLAPRTDVPEGFAVGETAGTETIRRAAEAAALGWREAGHPKVEIEEERIVARHGQNTVEADIAVQPGPQARLGQLSFSGSNAVRERRLRQIAGWPEGRVYSPELLQETAERLRRTGTFRSVALTEAETLDPGNRLDVTAQLAAEQPRRFGFGAEVDTVEGVGLSAFWLHRNLFGGAERFRVEGEVTGIGGATGGVNYSLGFNFDRPATLNSRTDLYVNGTTERLNEPTFTSDTATLGAGFLRRVNEDLTITAGAALTFAADENDEGMQTDYALLGFPLTAEYDRRDEPLNPASGYYLDLDLQPFVGLNDQTGSGARATMDARTYYGFGEADRVILAGRLQFGSIAGPDLQEVPNDFRFYSGGGGTVRGQEYQSLAITLANGVESGGASFVGLSAEIRAGVTENIQVVGFADYGFVGEEAFPGGEGNSHSGAGIGVRYLSRIGPIRFDVATPTSGDEEDGQIQLYVGIGQAF